MSESSTPLVRKATPADIDVIWALLRKKASFDRWLERMEATPAALAEAIAGPSPAIGAFIAEQEGAAGREPGGQPGGEAGREAVGFATYYFTFSTYLARKCVWIDDLFVDESKRRRGVGRALLREIVQVAREHQCARIEWVTAASNNEGISFYENLGARVRTSTRLCRIDQHAMTALSKTLEIPVSGAR